MGLNPHIGMPELVGVCLRRPDSQASSSHLSHFKGFAIHLAVTHSSIHWLACLLTLFTYSFIRSFVRSFLPSFIHSSLYRASLGSVWVTSVEYTQSFELEALDPWGQAGVWKGRVGQERPPPWQD